MIALRDTPLDVAAVMAAVGGDEHGGTAAFVGTTRREGGDLPVAALHYEAYEELALDEMRGIAAEARAAWSARVAMAHRLGEVRVGQPSVVVAASAGHRDAAFAACRFAIDELKRRAPIWKRVLREDGTASWLDGTGRGRPVVASPGGGDDT